MSDYSHCQECGDKLRDAILRAVRPLIVFLQVLRRTRCPAQDQS